MQAYTQPHHTVFLGVTVGIKDFSTLLPQQKVLDYG